MSAPSNTPEELAEAFANLNAAVASTPPSHPDYDKLVRNKPSTHRAIMNDYSDIQSLINSDWGIDEIATEVEIRHNVENEGALIWIRDTCFEACINPSLPEWQREDAADLCAKAKEYLYALYATA